MSLYQLDRAVFDNMRAGEVCSGTAPAFDISSYGLTDDERTSVESRDIAALYVMGPHPVHFTSGVTVLTLRDLERVTSQAAKGRDPCTSPREA